MMLPVDDLIPEARFAIEMIRQAAAVARQVQESIAGVTSLTKSDSSPVTIADLSIQALTAACLANSFPGDPLVAEEDASNLLDAEGASSLEAVIHIVQRYLPKATREATVDWIGLGASEPTERYWTLDPLDGTKGFLRGGQYATALALIVSGEVRLAVLGCPKLSAGGPPANGGPGSFVLAVRGQGSWAAPLEPGSQFTRLRVSGESDLQEARILRSYETSHTNADLMDDLIQARKIARPPLAMDSQAKYAGLSSGQAELLFRFLSPAKPDYREWIWDQAAGSLIVEEAGGRVTDLDGKTLAFGSEKRLVHNRGIIASNRVLHDEAAQAVRDLLGPHS